MNLKKSEVASEARRIKKRLIDAHISIADLARRIGTSREALSKTINHDRFPRVRAKLQKELSRL